ncbi:SIS domain-containing protein [Phenylobacterium montanum]|nr:SIS domain-containing protein [Caulobacter sp. S6]
MVALVKPKVPAPESTRMFAEAAEAAGVVRAQIDANGAAVQALAARLRSLKPRAVATIARGSSDHACTFAKYLIETRLGLMTASAAPSVTSLYDGNVGMAGVVCLAVSQSGKSPDLLQAATAAKAAGGFVVALVNVEDSPLAALADAVVPLRAGPELSVAATKSYIAALSAITHLVAAWTEDAGLMQALNSLPEQLEAAWAQDWSAGVKALKSAHNLFVIGRGVGFGVAQEAALKFKETCGLHAEAFSAAEVRHGPMALVGPGFPILAFAQNDESLAGVDELLAEFAGRGATVLAAGASPQAGVTALPSPGADAAIAPIVMVQSFYRMANALSVARGFDPDRPPHLNKVTETV